MEWDKLKSNHYYDQPVDHICITNLIDLNEYDRLYENQNNLNHQTWKEFTEKYKTTAQLHETIADIDFNKDVMCLWFFKERSDGTAAYIHINGKQIKYAPNVFLLTKSKSIKFVPTKRKYIRNPVIQLDVDLETYNNLIKKFQK
jgi:hypothetical protein|tara:strand:+ start:1293 stop:1724 length:432 start_codon:yes stop_codon:yes gene_type:complete